MTIPTSLLVPGSYTEVDNSHASQGAPIQPYQGLVVGQKIAAGSAAGDSIVRVTSAEQSVPFVGRGSQAHRALKAWFAENKLVPTFVGVLADNGAGVAASGTAVITGPATATGTLCFYIGGDLVPVAVTSGDSANTIAAALNAAINASTLDLPVTSGVSTNTVTITARNKGTCGNDIDLRLNLQTGDATPAGVGVTITAMASGATDPSLTGLISAMGDTWFNVITMPYTSTAALAAMETELASRFGYLRMVGGQCFVSKKGSVSAVTSVTTARNSPHVFFVTDPSDTPVTASYETAASAASAAAEELSADPALPLQTVALNWVKAPNTADEFTLAERNTLLTNGAGTLKTGPGGVVQIERPVSTYRLNAAGAPDTSYRDLTTMATISYLRYSFRAKILTKYARAKLVDDGTRAAPGQKVITPKVGKAEAVAWFRDMEELVLVENADQFKADLVVRRNSQDRNRLDFILPPDLANFLAVSAITVQFLL